MAANASGQGYTFRRRHAKARPQGPNAYHMRGCDEEAPTTWRQVRWSEDHLLHASINSASSHAQGIVRFLYTTEASIS